MTCCCSTDGLVGGTPAEPQVHLQSIGLPRSGRSAEASPHQLTAQNFAAAGLPPQPRSRPCRPLIQAGSPTTPPLRTQPNPLSHYNWVKDTSGPRVTMPGKAQQRQAHDHPDRLLQRQRAQYGTFAPVRLTTPVTTWAKRNTDNLGWTEDADGTPDRQGGCRPVAVSGSFEVVAAHLAACDAGVGA